MSKSTQNKSATRYYSDAMEKRVCSIINGQQSSNSGASKFSKSDVSNNAASLSCECKCAMSPKDSISIKKEWLIKHHNEAFAMRRSNEALAIDFGPGTPIYFLIDTKLMRYLVEKLEIDNGCI